MRKIFAKTNRKTPRTYEAKRGDTLESISKQFNISSQSLAQMNKISPGVKPTTGVRPGTQLLIPQVETIDPFGFIGPENFSQYKEKPPPPPDKTFKGLKQQR